MRLRASAVVLRLVKCYADLNVIDERSFVPLLADDANAFVKCSRPVCVYILINTGLNCHLEPCHKHGNTAVWGVTLASQSHAR